MTVGTRNEGSGLGVSAQGFFEGFWGNLEGLQGILEGFRLGSAQSIRGLLSHIMNITQLFLSGGSSQALGV